MVGHPQGLTCLPQELCSTLEQEHVDLQMAKEGVERKTQELRKEGELCKNFEQQMSLNRDEEGSLQVGGRRTRHGLGKGVVGGGMHPSARCAGATLL